MGHIVLWRGLPAGAALLLCCISRCLDPNPTLNQVAARGAGGETRLVSIPFHCDYQALVRGALFLQLASPVCGMHPGASRHTLPAPAMPAPPSLAAALGMTCLQVEALAKTCAPLGAFGSGGGESSASDAAPRAFVRCFVAGGMPGGVPARQAAAGRSSRSPSLLPPGCQLLR